MAPKALVYYRSQREFSVPVKQLGEGTHRFQAYIYPNVTGWESRVSSIPLDKTVKLCFPEVSHSCSPEMTSGYFLEQSATCNCTVTSDGYPRDHAQWFTRDVTPQLEHGTSVSST
ncbi:hypothetical protein RRG08_059034 [Elysia crispata]|uniref:Uncharacterized protein n=1 Tax=Elysia crispata TaxID=231223 RepID=A0AAE1DY04_9GAST|nr:hypothetical protein RRG08_059034 [Elysia crispata]